MTPLLAVPAAPASYDADLAKALWDLSADRCGLAPGSVCAAQGEAMTTLQCAAKPCFP